MAAEGENGNRMYVNVGDVIRLHLPHSKVCIDWGVAGRAVNVELVEGSAGLPGLQPPPMMSATVSVANC